MKTRRDPRTIVLRLSAMLLVLTLLSTCIVAGTYSRFTTSDSGSDGARVAKFSLSETNLTDSVTLAVKMAPGGTVSRTVAVQNNSEVSVNYIITIKNTTKNLPLSLWINGEEQTSGMNSAAGYAFASALLPNSALHNLSFELRWPAAVNDPIYSGMVDEIQITVTAVQID